MFILMTLVGFKIACGTFEKVNSTFESQALF